ncbi:GDNF family receptor alpha-like [Centropristis striata]|uniref:GDNF family receptor alpha-like n=1 Tax=Centropristis striata TaxID=184440 RepID=UPI0027E20E85|nr:GDNF family receptor alpha-like [Centropristis striata]
MQPLPLQAALIIGIVIPQISSISISSPPPDCVAAVYTCMSNLCKWSEKAFHGDICEDDGCQIKGSEQCNLTIQTVMDHFPSLSGCVCAWEEELCDSIQALATQCHQKPAAQQRRSTEMDWQSSSLIGYVNNGAASCLDHMINCLKDKVCNRNLAPVSLACMAQCNRSHCQRETQQFYGSMPHNVAEMLFMCECEASDRSCLHMKALLHSGTCGDQTWICQDTVNQCVEDSNCRQLLKAFRAKCWSPEEAQCSDSDLQSDECITQMDPGLIRGADSECRIALLATMGTALHYPCECKGMRNEDLAKCNVIHDVFHNRSHFLTSWKSSSHPTKPPEVDDSEQSHAWSHDYLLLAFAIVLLFGVVILMPLAVVSRIWMLRRRRRDKTKFHHPQKGNCVL